MSEGDWEGLVGQEARDRIDLGLKLGLDWFSVDPNYSRHFSHGSEQAVREETLRVLELFKDHPDFILASSNSVHNDVPPRNFMAMVAAYRDFFGR